MARSGAFTTSGLLHAAVLAWVAHSRPPTAATRVLEAREIASEGRRIIWFRVPGRLPDISPLERRGVLQPPKAEQRAEQPVVARGERRARQLVWEAAPQIELARDLRAPNLLALSGVAPPSPPAKPKLFLPPRAEKMGAAPELTGPPEMRPAASLEAPLRAGLARPRPRDFIAPERQGERAAPQVAPPPEVRPGASLEAPLRAGLARPRPRDFIAPERQGERAAPQIASPPEMHASTNFEAPLQLDIPRAKPRAFIAGRGAPPAASELPEAPELPDGSAPLGVAAAVVGLRPSERLEAPLPPGSRSARFSAGPQIREAGGDGEPIETARIFVPDLMVRGRRNPQPVLVARAAPSAEQTLRAALAERLPATRVAAAPAVHFQGRTVYAMALQMPNVSSRWGSWMVWFAERVPEPGAVPDMRAPAPLRKVDPKYMPSAMADGVEGVVRLAAVIRRDGAVGAIALLQRLDERLDRSAAEALAQWQFSPALRNGVPVDVDAIFEVPFRLRAPEP